MDALSLLSGSEGDAGTGDEAPESAPAGPSEDPPPAAKRCRGPGEASGALTFGDLQSAGYRAAPPLCESAQYLRDAVGQELRRPPPPREEPEAAEAPAVASAEPPPPPPQRVEVRGGGAPEPWESFEDRLPAELLRPLLAAGIRRPTPIQAHAAPALAAGRDVVGVAQTGSGKTLAYLLPCLLRLRQGGGATGRLAWSPPALVLGPTRELVRQIAEEAERFRVATGIATAAVYGGAPRGEQLAAIRGRPEVLVATPGRLVDFLLEDQSAISLQDVRLLVLDEADRMLDDGFGPQMQRLAAQAAPGERQTAMFSATWPPSVQRLAGELLRDPVEFHVVRGSADGTASGTPLAGDTVEQDVCFCEERDKSRNVVGLLRGRPRARAIVFTATKRACRELARSLRGAVPGRVEAIHGDRSQAEREAALAAFRDGSARVLCATDVAGRGLDVPGIDLVVNVDAPISAEDYVHRIGRTGRAGAKGLAVSLLTPQDGDAARYILEVIRASGARAPEELERRVGPGLVSGRDDAGASLTSVMTLRE